MGETEQIEVKYRTLETASTIPIIGFLRNRGLLRPKVVPSLRFSEEICKAVAGGCLYTRTDRPKGLSLFSLSPTLPDTEEVKCLYGQSICIQCDTAGWNGSCIYYCLKKNSATQAPKNSPRSDQPATRYSKTCDSFPPSPSKQ